MTRPSTILGLAAVLTATLGPPGDARARTPPATPGTADAPARATIRFEGNTSYDAARLRAALRDSINQINTKGLTPPRADDAAFFLELFYRRHGFARALANWEIDGDTLRLDITEGPRVQLGEIRIQGLDTGEARDRAREFLVGPTRERFSRLQVGLPFIRSDMRTGASKLIEYYHSEGYLDATVSLDVQPPTGNPPRIDPEVTVTRGPRSLVGSLTITGDTGKVPRDRLRQVAETGDPMPYSRFNRQLIADDIREALRAAGHYEAAVDVRGGTPAPPSAAGVIRVPVVADVRAGRVFRFGMADLSGADERVRGFLRRRFQTLDGREFTPERLRGITRRILETGIFSDFRIHTEPRPDGALDLRVTAREGRTKQFGLFLGYESFEGSVANVIFRDFNLFGSATSLTANIGISARSLIGAIEYNDPWILDENTGFRARLSGKSIAYDGYESLRYQSLASIETRPLDPLTLTASLAADSVTLRDIGIPREFVGADNYLLGGLLLAGVYDRRNDKLNPTDGWTAGINASALTANQSFSYLRLGGRWSGYVPVGDCVLALGARGTVLFPTGEEERFPIDERLFTGGPDSVRSFAFRELGPTAPGGAPVGGNTRVVLNAEFLVPLVGQLYLVTFADAGAINRESLRLASDDFRYALGAGLQYKLPIGPLRVEYGWNPDRREGEATGAFHIAFGFAF